MNDSSARLNTFNEIIPVWARPLFEVICSKPFEKLIKSLKEESPHSERSTLEDEKEDSEVETDN